MSICPTEDTLRRITEWDVSDRVALFDFIASQWEYPTRATRTGNMWNFSTGGWSGNEMLIQALRENVIAWAVCWMSSRRGGHYEFEVKKMKGDS